MTTATTGKGERTQARLLEAAVAAFGIGGFRATSVAAVARHVGVSPAAAFTYWPSKEALFEAAVDADAHSVIAELLAAVDTSTDPDRWFRLVDLLLGVLDRHPLARRVLAGHEPEVVDRVLEIPAFADLRAQLTALIASHQAAGEVRVDIDPAQAAIGMETLTLALVTWRLQLRAAPSRARQAGVTEILAAALRPPD